MNLKCRRLSAHFDLSSSDSHSTKQSISIVSQVQILMYHRRFQTGMAIVLGMTRQDTTKVPERASNFCTKETTADSHLEMDVPLTHITTSLCVRDNACISVCPVECINPGNPAEQLAAYKDEMPLDPFA